MAVTCAVFAIATGLTAATMRLAKILGTVEVSTDANRTLPAKASMRLYDGYRLETKVQSYAWINLDNVKLTKLDEASRASLRKKGKELEILLESGGIFFNVQKPLDEDESLSIRTSSMAVGIRGTSGWVRVIDDKTSMLSVLEGTVQVTVQDPVTGQSKIEPVTAGETVIGIIYEPTVPGDKCDILRDKYVREDIPGFVLVELAQYASLTEKIYRAAGLDLRSISSLDAQSRLSEDERAHREQTQIMAIGNQPPQDGDGYPRGDIGNEQAQDGDTRGDTRREQTHVTPPNTIPENTGLTVPPAAADLTPNSAPNATPETASGATSGSGADDDSDSDSGTASVTHTVIFDLNQGPSSAIALANALVSDGGKVTDPAYNAIYDNKIVTGWYQNAACTQRWDFAADTVTKDTTLYARWRNRLGDINTWWDLAAGTLTIGGNGRIPDYTDSNAPWHSDRGTITNLVIESGVTGIGKYAFSDCSRLAIAAIGDNVEDIGEYAFNYCESLDGLTIPDSVQSIGGYAFQDCHGLKNLTIGRGVTVIDGGAFSYCTGLTSLTIPGNVEYFNTQPHGAFQGCTSLASITIEQGNMKGFGSRAFLGCTSLTTFTIPSTVHALSNWAFQDCTGLKSIYIPASTSLIRADVFDGCTSLENIYYAGSEEQWKALEISSKIDAGKMHYNQPAPPNP